MPLANLSGDAGQEYFADGMTDELITDLARIHDLRVVSRTSVMQEKGTQKTLRQIAREFDVDAIVEGSVVRSGERVRITAQLIDARSDRHLWAQSFEGSAADVLSLQDSVASEIASHAAVVIHPEDRPEPGANKALNPAAYDAYLRGRACINKRQPAQAIGYFEEAITLDTNHAQFYAGAGRWICFFGAARNHDLSRRGA